LHQIIIIMFMGQLMKAIIIDTPLVSIVSLLEIIY